jgi:hypothetical protein
VRGVDDGVDEVLIELPEAISLSEDFARGELIMQDKSDVS